MNVIASEFNRTMNSLAFPNKVVSVSATVLYLAQLTLCGMVAVFMLKEVISAAFK